MSKAELDNLVGIGKLKLEPASRAEFDGMVSSARTRLTDAQNEGLDSDSRFDLAYGAAHRLALVSLRHLGYRSGDRLQSSKRSFTPWEQTRPISKSSFALIISAIWPNTRAVPTLVRNFWLI